MTSNLIRAALACAVLAFTSTGALATVTPSQSTPIILDGDPGGIMIAKGTTDAKGRVTFRDLKAGKYVLVISGPDLAAAFDRLPPPKKESSGVSISIGGGLFGGGHSGSGHEGAAPAGGGGSGGGVGAGVSIPIGGSGSGPDPRGGYVKIDLSEILISNLAARPPEPVSAEVPYCRDAKQGARIYFTVPDGGGTVTMQMSIADQASAGNLTSY